MKTEQSINVTEAAATADAALHDIEERIAAGDGSVTAEDLAQTRDAAALAHLRLDAANRREALEVEATEQAKLQRDRDQLRADVATHTDRLAVMQADYSALVAALRQLPVDLAGWAKQQAVLRSRAASLAVSGPELGITIVDKKLPDVVADAAAEAQGRTRRHPVTGEPMVHMLHSAEHRAAILAAYRRTRRHNADLIRQRSERRQADAAERERVAQAELDALTEREIT
jgi:hypothetical protein